MSGLGTRKAPLILWATSDSGVAFYYSRIVYASDRRRNIRNDTTLSDVYAYCGRVGYPHAEGLNNGEERKRESGLQSLLR